MAYKKYKSGLFLRLLILLLSLIALAFAIVVKNPYYIVPAALISLILSNQLFRFITRRFTQMDDFFESVKYRDFSRWFNDRSGPEDMRELHRGFNEVNKTIKQINSEKEAQHLYLQKILEMVDTGIIAYNTTTNIVLWVNDAFKEMLGVPSFKKLSFLEKRKPSLYKDIFEKEHTGNNITTIDVENEKIKILLSASVFTIGDETFKLVALQNVDATINQTESESWKKLLSVMTHEIMNSIAPISSLAETLQNHVRQSIQDPGQNPLEISDLDAGIESIKKRSEGLMMFAKTYRSLNKVTSLNLKQESVNRLFENIKNLMQPSLNIKNIKLSFNQDNPDMQIEIDAYLIEQVLINLLLNSVEAFDVQEEPKIMVSAYKNEKGNSILKVSDNGKGIPDEIIDKIFVPFFTTKKSGSGIGLSLCKQIMLLHKGRIQIYSVEGKGSSLSLVFTS